MPIRILPVGDSITQGQNTSYGSYRRHLYSLLTADGLDVVFVGPLSDGSFPSPAHDGVTGDVINGAWGRIASGRIETYTPDIILLLIGTNDILGGGSPSTALGTYSSLLDSIITHGPNVKTIVGSLPPMNSSVVGSTVSSNVNVFNSGLVTLVASKGSNFIFADLNTGLLTSDLADGIHPTDAGNDKLAALWYPALYVYLLDGSGIILDDGSGNLLTALIVNEGSIPAAPPELAFPFFLSMRLMLWS
jgi:hypothetical protein